MIVKKKPFECGDLKGWVQLNEARKGSTVAKVDAQSIAQRKCFLCRENRPADQEARELVPGWELLVNPYPVFEPHYTIASKEHTPQVLSVEVASKWAEILPGMVVFYNDPGAGASAPDHAHYQAVRKECLPLINLLDSNWQDDWEIADKQGIYQLNLPFKIFAGSNPGRIDKLPSRPLNAYIWKTESGDMRYVIIPRRAHRPDLYFLDPPERRAFSPGAIDMAGVLITPFEEDYDNITPDEIYHIYEEVGFRNE